MNILFITLEMITDIHNRGLYTDVLREFEKKGHKITVFSAKEKRAWKSEKRRVFFSENTNIRYALIKTGNITKNRNFLSKGISVILAGYQYLWKLKRLKNNKFDLVICTTPSITFEPCVRYAKKRNKARVVLLLKDMWPYDLVFDGILTNSGLKGIIYRYFERIARKLTDDADLIGCMSPKNIAFLCEAAGDPLLKKKACLIPNSIEPLHRAISEAEHRILCEKYNLPEGKTIFLYGGNLGVAQGIDFVMDAIEKASKQPDTYFMIVGNGTEASKVKHRFENVKNVIYYPAIEHDEFEKLVYCCDVGMIFLAWNCHTPNIPSRILPLMQAGKPIICCTDDTSDIGKIAEENKFGIKCSSNSCEQFENAVKSLLYQKENRDRMGNNARNFLEKYWSAEATYYLIMNEKREL